MLALGLVACSFSFKAGSSASGPDQKPAVQEPGTPASGATTKPIPNAESAEPAADAAADPATDPATEPAAPTERPPVFVAATVKPLTTAVCRIEDDGLVDLCHAALDPVAADDFAAWRPQLAAGVTLLRPSYKIGKQRLEGADAIGAAASGRGLRGLLNLEPADRVVVTLHGDCRDCEQAFVAFEANTRSGTVVVTVAMSEPPQISKVELGSRLQRKPLLEARPKSTGTIEAPSSGGTATIEAPADGGASGGTEGEQTLKPKK